MAGARRKARKITLQVLYEVDSVGHDVADVLARFLTRGELSEDNESFIQELVHGVIRNQDKIDQSIRSFAPAWPLEQLAVIDRNILRLAIFEILFDNRASVKVVINEAVELAKSFGGDNSPKFVNGVLGSISTLASR